MPPERLDHQNQEPVDLPDLDVALVRDVKNRYGLSDRQPITDLRWEKQHDLLREVSAGFHEEHPPEENLDDRQAAAETIAHELVEPIRQTWEKNALYPVDSSGLAAATSHALANAILDNDRRRLTDLYQEANRWGGDYEDPTAKLAYSGGSLGQELLLYQNVNEAAHRQRSADQENRHPDFQIIADAGYAAVIHGVAASAVERYALIAEDRTAEFAHSCGDAGPSTQMAWSEHMLSQAFIAYYSRKLQPGQEHYPSSHYLEGESEDRHERRIGYYRDFLDPMRAVGHALEVTAFNDVGFPNPGDLRPTASKDEALATAAESRQIFADQIANPQLKELGLMYHQAMVNTWEQEPGNYTEHSAAILGKMLGRIRAADNYLSSHAANYAARDYTIQYIVEQEQHEVMLQEPNSVHPLPEGSAESAAQYEARIDQVAEDRLWTEDERERFRSGLNANRAQQAGHYARKRALAQDLWDQEFGSRQQAQAESFAALFANAEAKAEILNALRQATGPGAP